MIHLIHPATVHFTVAFLITGGLLEAYGIFGKRPGVERFGGALVLLGTVSLVLSVVSGFLAENTVNPPVGARGDIERHERAGLILLAVFLVATFWKGWDRGRVRDSNRPLYALWILGGTLLAAVVAWLGGELVYVHGVGVGPQG